MLEQIQKIAAPEEVLESVRASLALLKLEMKAFMDQCKTQNAKKLEWKFVIAQYAALCEKLQPTTDASWGEACARCELDIVHNKYSCQTCQLVFCAECEDFHDHDLLRSKRKAEPAREPAGAKGIEDI